MGLFDLFKKKETQSEGWKYYTQALNYPERREEYLEKAVELNEPHAMCALARFILENRLFTQKNLQRAVQLYEDAEAAGAMPTYAKLAFAYTKLGEEEKAIASYQKGAEAGQTDSQDILGMLYHEGKGVKKDDKKAFELVQAAAEEGNFSACGHLAYFLYHGKGAPKDYEAALIWARKGFGDEKNPYSRYVMAMLYRDGKVIEQDYLTALYEMKELAEEGMEEAKQGLEWVRASAGKEAERLFSEGWAANDMNKIEQAARLGNIDACFTMVQWILQEENRKELDEYNCRRYLDYYDEYERQRKEGVFCLAEMTVDTDGMRMELLNEVFHLSRRLDGLGQANVLDRLLPYGYANVFYNLGINEANRLNYENAYYYLEQAKTAADADEELRRKADELIRRIKRYEAEE